MLLGINAHINYDLPQALLAVISDEDFADRASLDRRRRDHERIDGVLVGPGGGRGRRARGAGRRAACWTGCCSPSTRGPRKRFLREARVKVWHNTVELQQARLAGPDVYAERLGELEVLSAAKIADLLAPGQVLLRLAVAGFGVVLPPPG